VHGSRAWLTLLTEFVVENNRSREHPLIIYINEVSKFVINTDEGRGVYEEIKRKNCQHTQINQ